jgi:hypothetical protein
MVRLLKLGESQRRLYITLHTKSQANIILTEKGLPLYEPNFTAEYSITKEN